MYLRKHNWNLRKTDVKKTKLMFQVEPNDHDSDDGDQGVAFKGVHACQDYSIYNVRTFGLSVVTKSIVLTLLIRTHLV